MRVFVLTTGRSGSVTFARACGHLTNFTSGHETGWPTTPDAEPTERLTYADRHIEVDNRLVWLMGPLHRRYPDAVYVHLTRDPEAVAASFAARWTGDPPPAGDSMLARARRKMNLAPRPGVSAMAMFAYPMLGRSRAWPATRRLDIARMMVDTVNGNIGEFLANKPHMTIDLANAADVFPRFCAWVDAEGDLDAAAAEFSTLHNARRRENAAED